MAKYFIPPIDVGRGPMISEWIRSSSSGWRFLDQMGVEVGEPSLVHRHYRRIVPQSMFGNPQSCFWTLVFRYCQILSVQVGDVHMVFMSIDFDFIRYVEC